jgi:hypothetical protein
LLQQQHLRLLRAICLGEYHLHSYNNSAETGYLRKNRLYKCLFCD